jgi:hypothetical protein
MAYTGHSDYVKNDPSSFVVTGNREDITSASKMEWRVDALQNAGIDVEFHKCPNAGMVLA